MNKLLYARLAGGNLIKNRQKILPYLISAIGTVILFFIMASLSVNDGLNQLPGAETIYTIMELGTQVIGLFAIVFLIYSNSFLVKRRKKEFGLFQVLGMEKKHIGMVLFFENFYLLLLCLIPGIALGCLLYQLMFLLLGRLTGLEGTFSFTFSPKALLMTVVLLSGIYLFNFLTGLAQVKKTQPAELLKGEHQGEKEPKAKIFTTLLGIVTLGAGYYLAITCKDPLEALTIFFAAVILVGIGTHCLFSSGSIALLKLLKRNKNYYYRLKHFTGVSGMLYRMKQNAAGLANICILSTGVLLIVSITACLWTGIEETLGTRYPSQIEIQARDVTADEMDLFLQTVQDSLKEQGVTAQKMEEMRAVTLNVLKEGNHIYVGDADNISASQTFSMTWLYLMTAEEYSLYTGVPCSLPKGSVGIQSPKENNDFAQDTVLLGNQSWNVASLSDAKDYSEDVVDSMILVAADESARNEILQCFGITDELPERWALGMDFDLSAKEQIAVGVTLEKALSDLPQEHWIDIRETQRDSFKSLYGTLMFLGIFIGSLFLMATVMIVYYKQISEGYEDRNRFIIMQKVGMSKKEVRASIRSQVLTVFYLPLITAIIHTIVAFPITVRLMRMLNFGNKTGFMIATAVTAAVFAVIYTLVYAWTARSYYKIVES